jgi:5-methylcytosine-specific restriction endonuclease McrA
MILNLPNYIYEKPDDKWIKKNYPKAKGFEKKILKKVARKIYIRTILSERQNHRCAVCGTFTYVEVNEKNKNRSTYEHIKCKADGGEVSLDNGVVTCYGCNNKRGVMDLFEFYKTKLC